MDHVLALELQLDQRVDGHDEGGDITGQGALLMDDHAVSVVVVPAELVTPDHDQHLLVGDGLEVLLELVKAVTRNGEHDYQRGDSPGDLESGMPVGLRGDVANRLFRAPVAKHDPEQRDLNADKDDESRD